MILQFQDSPPIGGCTAGKPCLYADGNAVLSSLNFDDASELKCALHPPPLFAKFQTPNPGSGPRNPIQLNWDPLCDRGTSPRSRPPRAGLRAWNCGRRCLLICVGITVGFRLVAWAAFVVRADAGRRCHPPPLPP